MNIFIGENNCLSGVVWACDSVCRQCNVSETYANAVMAIQSIVFRIYWQYFCTGGDSLLCLLYDIWLSSAHTVCFNHSVDTGNAVVFSYLYDCIKDFAFSWKNDQM